MPETIVAESEILSELGMTPVWIVLKSATTQKRALNLFEKYLKEIRRKFSERLASVAADRQTMQEEIERNTDKAL